MKQTSTINDYNLKLSWCAETKKVWTVDFCTKVSSLWKCLTWYHEFTKNELILNKDKLFIGFSYNTSAVTNFPHRWSQYKATSNLGKFTGAQPTYHLAWLNNTKYDSDWVPWVSIVKDKFISIMHLTSYTQWDTNYEYYHFSWVKEEWVVSIICVKD